MQSFIGPLQAFSTRYARIVFATIVAAALMGGFFVSYARATTPPATNLSVTLPDGTEYWRGQQSIAWSASTTATTMNILYSSDPSTFLNIAVPNVTIAPTGSSNWSVASIPNGTYYIELKDSLDETVVSSAFNIDNTAPVTTATEAATPDGSTGWYNVTNPVGDITLSCNDSSTGGSGCSSISYEWIDVSTGAVVTPFATSTGSGPVTISAANIPQGDNKLVYYSEDNAVDQNRAHNVETAQAQEFKVDTVAPTITSYTVNGGSSDVYFNPNSASITIALTASEPVEWNTVRIQSVTDPSVYKDLHPGNDGYATTTITWDGSLTSSSGIAPDGAYDITYKVTDEAGNVTSTEGGTPLSGAKIVVDTAAPTIGSYASPVADSIYTSSSLLTFTPADTGGTGATPITCGYSLNGAATTTIACTSGSAITNGAVTGLVEGRNTLALSVVDAAGNSVYEAPVSFVYDSNHTLTVSGNPSDNADFTTIQSAIDAAQAASLSNETIDVKAGTYDSFSVVGASDLTVQGAGAGQTIIAPSTLVDTGVADKYDADMHSSVFVNNSTGITLKDMTIQSTSVTPDSNNNNAIIFWNSSSGTIADSDITGTYTIDGVQTGQGIAVDASSGTHSLTVSNVNISGFQKNGIQAIDGNGATSGASDTITLTVSGGSITGAGPTAAIAQNGVLVWNRGGGTVTGTVDGTTISGFDYTPASNPGDYATGILAYGGAGITSVHNSTFSNDPQFTISTTAGSGNIDATNNYWGTAVSSAIASRLNQDTGTITYDPYYVDPAKTILSNRMVSDVYVDNSYTDGGALPSGQYFGYNAFSTVQDGVDAAALNSGGTVHVAAGTYNESVTVNRALTIEGANVGVAGSGSRGTESQVKSFTVGASDVTIDGFTLTKVGSQMTIGTSSAVLSGDVAQNNIFNGYSSVGMPTSNAGDLLIKDNLFENAAANSEAMQIKADGEAGGCTGTTVMDNTFTAAGNNNGADVNFSCTGSASSNITVSNNTDTGNSNGQSFAAFAGVSDGLLVTGNSATTAGSALYFWGGMTGSTTIADNQITGGSSSSGISIHDSLDGVNTGTFTITGNTIKNSGYGIYVASGSLTGGAMNVSGNTISGNSSYGIDNNDTSVTVNAEKNWWGDATGPYHTTKNPNGLANKVSDYVDFSPLCLESGCTTFGSVDPIASISLTADPSSVAVPFSSTVTATALDANGYTIVNDNNNTQLHFSADHGASLGALYVDLGTDGTATTSVSNSATGVTNVAAEVVGASPAVTGSTQVTFTPGDTTPPTVSTVSPANSATGVSINVVPQIDFSEALAQATVDSANVYLKTNTTTIPATVALVEGGTRVTITPSSPLAYYTNYTIVVSTSVTDLSGNALAAEYDSTFTTESAPVSTTPPTITSVQVSNITTTGATITWTTDQDSTSQVEYGSTSSYGSLTSLDSTLSTSHSVTLSGLSANTMYHFRVASVDALGNAASSTDNVFTTPVDNSSAVLAVTGIDSTNSYATPDNTFGDGWNWTFHVTIPTGQNYLGLKFSDFISGTSTIPAAGNIEYYSPQSSAHNATSSAVVVAGADAYPPAMLIDGTDLDPSTPGTQVEVMVETKVPTDAAGGSYSSSYGVKSSDTSF